MSLRLLHISDIHFSKYDLDSAHWDLDSDIQNEVERDLRKFCNVLGSIQVILIGGDIAFSGAEDEYQAADLWLKRVSEIVGCKLENILTIPGNHDVDRTKIKGLLFNVHKQFRALRKRTELDKNLQSMLDTPADAEHFLKPFDNYHKFAAKYGSVPNGNNKLYWEKAFDLAPFKVRIRGVNSALISNKDDDEHSNRLFLGSHQTNIRRDPGVISVFMCHHPPEWLLDKGEVETDVLAKSIMHLYGHEHKEGVKTVNGCLILSAGAMQPSRIEGEWQPCYNIIDLEIVKKRGRYFLAVKVWKRIFDKEKTRKFIAKFTASGEEYEEFELPLDPEITDFVKAEDDQPKSASKTEMHETRTNGAESLLQPQLQTDDQESIDVNKQDYTRKLAYMFLSLPYHKKLKIAVGLDLCEDSDEKLPELEKSQLYIKRAKDRVRLRELWDQTVSVHPHPENYPNPFNP